jgi:hypothetical protein
MLNSLLFLGQLFGTCILALAVTMGFGILLCDFTNRFRWVPIALYILIIWGSIISACFVEPQLVLRAVL